MIDPDEIEVGQPIYFEHIRTGDKAVGHVQAIDEEMIKISRPPLIQGDSVSISNYYKKKDTGTWYLLEELRLV